MRKCKKKVNFEKSKEKPQISLSKNSLYFSDKYLLKEIEKTKKEALKTSIPLNYIKVNETLTTKVYKIPIENNIFREKNPNLKKEQKIFHKKFFLNNIKSNNDKLYNIQKNNYFSNKSFSSRELGYNYYNQIINPFTPHPHETKSKNYFYLKKSKSPPNLHTSFKSTNINTLYNKEGLNRPKSPLNSKGNKSLNNLLYPIFLSDIMQNKNHLHSSRIRHRIVNINRSNDFTNNKFNLYKEYNNNKSNKTINYNNYLHNRKRIHLDNNNNYSFNNNNFKNIYSINTSHISNSPRTRLPKNMSFLYDRNIESPHRYEKYDYFRGGKILNSLEKNKSKDGKYEIETTLSKIIYDKQDEEIKTIENEQENHSRKNSSKTDLGDNYKYYERKETKTPIKNEKINHIRRTPVHVYGFENYITKDNKKIYLKTPPIKGKLIRLYRNNDNKNCRMCVINEVKRRKFELISKVKENNILFPAKYPKGKFDYYYIK